MAFDTSPGAGKSLATRVRAAAVFGAAGMHTAGKEEDQQDQGARDEGQSLIEYHRIKDKTEYLNALFFNQMIKKLV